MGTASSALVEVGSLMRSLEIFAASLKAVACMTRLEEVEHVVAVEVPPKQQEEQHRVVLQISTDRAGNLLVAELALPP